MALSWQKKEKTVEFIVSSVGFVSVIILLLISFFLFKEAFYIFYKAGVLKVLFGKAWYPTYDPPSFGMLSLIMGTLAVTLLTSVIAIPLGLATAIYIAEIAHHRVKEFLKPLVEMLASFPSVVLGFFGMVVIAPILSNWLSPILSEKLPELLRSTSIPFLSTTLADFCYNKLFIASGLNITAAALMLTVRAIPVISNCRRCPHSGSPYLQRGIILSRGK